MALPPAYSPIGAMWSQVFCNLRRFKKTGHQNELLRHSVSQAHLVSDCKTHRTTMAMVECARSQPRHALAPTKCCTCSNGGSYALSIGYRSHVCRTLYVSIPWARPGAHRARRFGSHGLDDR